MVMPSATGMAMMPEETASLAAAAVIMAAVDAEIRDGDSACMKCELRGRKPGGKSCPAFFPSVIKIFKNMLEIGATGFEPATSRPPAERATKLRHTPKITSWLHFAKFSDDTYRHLLKYYMHIIISKLHQKSTMTSKSSLPDVCFLNGILMVKWNLINGLLYAGRHFWNRKCRKKTWWQQEFAVFKCEATANSVTGHVCVNSNQ